MVWDTKMSIKADKSDMNRRMSVSLGGKGAFFYLTSVLDDMTLMQKSAHLHIWTLSANLPKSKELF